MRVDNRTPFLVGAKVTSRRPPRPEMTLVVRGAYVLTPGEPLRLPEGPFPLSQGSLSAETFREDDEARAGECLYPGDFADFKLRADVLLRGTCHAPRGRSVTECPVRFSVGAWSKTLRILGPRTWAAGVTGDTPTEPLGFTRMPLGYENAFGGPASPLNPVGKGAGTRELPTVEHVTLRVRSPEDTLPPAGFGPVNPAWPQRASKLGKEYGESYRRTRFPFHAEDLDWSHFNAAPEDQQIEGYLRGDEEASFHCLSPRAVDFSVKLPGLRVRAFMNDRAGKVRELRMILDTLFADVDEERLYLTWRGVEPVGEDDLHDVTTVLVVTEPLEGPKRPESEYHAALAAFEKDPLGKKLDPMEGPDFFRAAGEEAAASAAAPRGSPPPDPLTALLSQKLGGIAGAQQTQIARAVRRMRAVRLPPGVSLDALLTKAVNDAPAQALPALAGTPAAPRAPVGGALRKLLSNVAVLERAAAARGQKVEGLDALKALANDPRLAALDPAASRGGAQGAEELGPGKDLRGADLRGRDLTGIDLTGADLEGALLSGAILRGAELSRVNLSFAVLFEADLTAARLTGANLTGANLGSANAEEAVLEEAVLDKVNAQKARFVRAVFTRARSRDGIFEEAVFDGARLREATFEQSIFDDAHLAAADFTAATFTTCRCERVSGEGVIFERATITGSSFAGASLPKARFSEVNGQRSVWVGADLTTADLRFSRLALAHFTEASAREARFRCADLRGARFYRADLTGATFAEANLLGADLCKARLTRAKLTGASMYDAKLLGASLDDTDFEGANLTRSTLERT